MTIARAAAIGSLVVAILAVAVLMFGSGGSNPFTDGGRLGPEDCDPNIRPVGP
jgi:hypothetical protein